MALRLRRWRRAAAVVTIAGLAVVYFGYHALYGRLGLLAWEDLKAEIAVTEQALAEERKTNADLARRIGGLRPESPDPDAIETALRALGYARPDEFILLDR